MTGRDVSVPTTWGHRIAPQPSAPIFRKLGLAERGLAGRQQIEDDAESKQVAARIGAVAQHLFGRDIRASSNRALRLFLHQVRQLVMLREAEIDQYRFVSAQDHIAGL